MQPGVVSVGADTGFSQELDVLHKLVAQDPPELSAPTGGTRWRWSQVEHQVEHQCNQVEHQPDVAGTAVGQELRGKEDGAGQVAAPHKVAHRVCSQHHQCASPTPLL